MHYLKRKYYESHIFYYLSDALIAIGILGSLFLCIWHIYLFHVFSDPNIFHLILALIFLITAYILFYGSFIIPHFIQIVKKDIVLPKLKGKKIKVVFISDIHASSYKSKRFIKKVTKQVNEQKPELILIGGDFVSIDGSHSQNLVALAGLQASYGVYAVTGNHDFNIPHRGFDPNHKIANHVKEIMNKLGIKMLVDTNIRISGLPINLIGIEDIWIRSDQDNKDILRRLTNQIDCDLPSILLSHNPDVVQYFKDNNLGEKIDLILAGHTHAGQVQLPFIKELWVPGSVTPYYSDYHKINNTQLYITAGVGESGPRSRLFTYPEITVLTLKGEQ